MGDTTVRVAREGRVREAGLGGRMCGWRGKGEPGRWGGGGTRSALILARPRDPTYAQISCTRPLV